MPVLNLSNLMNSNRRMLFLGSTTGSFFLNLSTKIRLKCRYTETSTVKLFRVMLLIVQLVFNGD